MALPIQLKFFKKIELYQELKSQNEKAKEASDGILRKIWETEKRILRWTARHHHCLGSSIGHDYIRKNILGESNKEKYDWALTSTTENLIKREYAIKKEGDVTGIYFTREGLLMGEVVDDIEGRNHWSKWKYKVFFGLVWLTAITGALTVIINFIKIIFDIK